MSFRSNLRSCILPTVLIAKFINRTARGVSSLFGTHGRGSEHLPYLSYPRYATANSMLHAKNVQKQKLSVIVVEMSFHQTRKPLKHLLRRVFAPQGKTHSSQSSTSIAPLPVAQRHQSVAHQIITPLETSTSPIA